MSAKRKKFDFKKQLEIGQQGEHIFMERYPHKLTIHPGYDGDFIDSKGRKIELKTDQWCMDTETSNFFIERYSDFWKKTPGSFWQAYEHGCDIFCYMFVRNDTYFKFTNIEAVLEVLNKHIEDTKGRFIMIKNKGWQTAGFTIPREKLEDYYEVYTWKEEK